MKYIAILLGLLISLCMGQAGAAEGQSESAKDGEHTFKFVQAWSQPIQKVQGLTSGDWDEDGKCDLLVVREGELLVIDPATGGAIVKCC